MHIGKPVTEENFLTFITDQTVEWSVKDKEKFIQICHHLQGNTLLGKLNFPKKIQLIKTTGNEEGGAPYTRNGTAIIFPEKYLSQPVKKIEETLIHELLHIFSSNNKDNAMKLSFHNH